MNVSLKVTLNITYCERTGSWVRILVGFFREDEAIERT